MTLYTINSNNFASGNQLIEACGTEIREVNLKRIKEAKYFSLVFDDTTDISTISQLSIVITYVHGKKRYDYFVEFIDDHKAVFEDRKASQEPKVTGELLGKLVMKKLKEFGLNVNWCLGIGTDGCSVMTSEKVGVVKEIQKEATNAFRCPY
jgi:hypothetical protein